VYLDERATATFSSATVSNNIADGSGAGVAVAELATATFTGGTMSGNLAAVNGGAIYTCGDVDLSNVAFSVSVCVYECVCGRSGA
jgi:predicted outer membrane repeat protein